MHGAVLQLSQRLGKLYCSKCIQLKQRNKTFIHLKMQTMKSNCEKYTQKEATLEYFE